jgi:hypothetical protein
MSPTRVISAMRMSLCCSEARRIMASRDVAANTNEPTHAAAGLYHATGEANLGRDEIDKHTRRHRRA